MSFATEVPNKGFIPAPEGEWETPENRYHTLDASHLFPDYKRAFYLRLPPGTGIHKHIDANDCETDHVVIQTNQQARNFWIDADGKECSMHMEQGKRYKVNRGLLHWAHNGGETDRIHLLLEY